MASVNHTHTFINHHRTWLPLALIGAAFMILIAVASWPDSKERTMLTPDQTATAQEVKDEYQQTLRNEIATYYSNPNPARHEALLQTLLTVRVPPDYLTAHVNLVIAADNVDFSEAELEAQLATMAQEYAWLQ